MKNVLKENKNVLVCLLKEKKDLRILLKKKWYRIPKAHMPKRVFSYVAFYQPASFGERGGRIEYYARVLEKTMARRVDLLPKERNHPRRNDVYVKIKCGEIKKLSHPIHNIVPRRISFGFVTLQTLLSATNILTLYGVPETEEIIKKELDRSGIFSAREFNISAFGKRFRVDFAVFCKKGKIAIECDNKKAHWGKEQKKKDKIKNLFLRRSGWRVMCFKEKDIVEHLDRCLLRIEKSIKKLGGPQTG